MIDIPLNILFLIITFVPILCVGVVFITLTNSNSRMMLMGSFFKRFVVYTACVMAMGAVLERHIESNKPVVVETKPQPVVKPKPKPEPEPQPVVEPNPDPQPSEITRIASEPVVDQISIAAKPESSKEITDVMVNNAISFVTSYTIIQNSIRNSVEKCVKTGEDNTLCERQAYQSVNMKYEYKDALHATYKQQMSIIEASKK